MSSFTQPLIYSAAQGSAWLYIIKSSFQFYWRDDLTGEYVHVPKDRLTDFGSLPKWVQWVTGWSPTDSDIAKAYLIHDELVNPWASRTIYNTNPAIKPRPVRWSEATRWFNRACKVAGAKWYKRWSVVSAVAVYGVVRHLTNI